MRKGDPYNIFARLFAEATRLHSNSTTDQQRKIAINLSATLAKVAHIWGVRTYDPLLQHAPLEPIAKPTQAELDAERQRLEDQYNGELDAKQYNAEQS